MTDEGHYPGTRLYAKDSKGKLRTWGIFAHNYVVTASHGLVGGSQSSKSESITEGKAGRTKHEQMMLEINSDIKSKKDKGYVEDIEVAKNEQRTNSLGLLRPMLAHPIDKMSVKDTIIGSYWSRKLDGNRAMITKQDGELHMYCRNGKTINLPHIFEGLDLPEGAYLDGELYIHGMPLNGPKGSDEPCISRLIKKPQEASKELKFHCYDFVSGMPFKDRYLMLTFSYLGLPNIVICSQIEVTEGVDVNALTDQAIADGYEGGILRLADTGYLDGKKTNKMLKLKKFLDDEFVVSAINPSKDGWAVLTCIAQNGKEFGCAAPGTFAARQEVMDNKANYIGRTVQVKYAYLTADGLPFHPVPTSEGWVDRGELG